jgi:nucleoside-diphosphate-sugar epimerase
MIFITGINSFVGKYLADELTKRRIKFFGVDLNVKESKNLKKIDIRDKKIEKFIKPGATIIHLAAISTDKLCEESPDSAFDINVNGTINLINIANKKKVKKFIFASTEWVYGNFTEKLQKENNKIIVEKLSSLYAITKALGEKILLSKNNSFKKIILRFGIIYGNRSNNLSALESIFINCSKNNLITIGSKKTSRRFIHINDIVSGIIKMLSYKKSNTFNLTGSKDVLLEDIINKSCKILKKKVKIIEKSPISVSTRKPSNNKIKLETGWKQDTDLFTGMMQLKKFFNI